MGRLSGKIAVVLGAAGQGNMGQVIARRFREEGAQVMVADGHLDVLDRLAADIGGHAVACDIAKTEDLERLARAAQDAMGSVSIALNATGWGLLKPFLETTSEELARITALQFTEIIPYERYVTRN